MSGSRNTRRASAFNPKSGQFRSVRRPCFTLKRPLVFQVRKSLVEYVDEKLLKMNTSVFYQRIFILAKNVEPKSDSELQAAEVKFESDAMRAAEGMAEEDQHYSEVAMPDVPNVPEAAETTEVPEVNKDPAIPAGGAHSSVKIKDEIETETLTHTFRFNEYSYGDDDQETDNTEVEPEIVEQPKDVFNYFTEMLQELHAKCRELIYSHDPLCGLVLYMNDYTMMMLEGCEDMIGIFCAKLLERIPEYWKDHRVFHIEDHIKELYTRQLMFRRIPAAFLNEKFPPSTPTDEYLMGKQHLIIKDKLFTICSLISESMEPIDHDSSQQDSSLQTEGTDFDEMEGESEGSLGQQRSQPLSQMQRLTVAISETLPTDIFRKWLPEIQRIELVLASTRFYYTLEEFCGLYGQVPYRPDDDGAFWPIQNNLTPANIYRRSPFDINLTFAEYAAEMNRRLQEEQEKHKAEQEAAAAAEALAAAQTKPQAKAQKAKVEEEPEE
ncbi:hypothetical protein AWZ03_006446 [Drosophila navojoa]|uniref:Uncharacterized protein n=1 Tax=Drosophila navojoa TaxID=7232 RepID=A0A484BHF0_DRONA|nr:uncharacterized protein LOC115562568 [Drosophila navojoa]TDG47181.1 hypothetical protein AWZ03_006446 [Drosophila navojoa]